MNDEGLEGINLSYACLCWTSVSCLLVYSTNVEVNFTLVKVLPVLL